MSIDYFGVKTDDPKRVGELIEADTLPADIQPIDTKALHAALTKRGMKGELGGQLVYKRNLSFVSVFIEPTCVQLNHNTAGDFDDIMDIVMDVQFAMIAAGLNVWDPQQGSWFPGSPVLAKKKPAAKRKTTAKPKPRKKR